MRRLDFGTDQVSVVRVGASLQVVRPFVLTPVVGDPCRQLLQPPPRLLVEFNFLVQIGFDAADRLLVVPA